jgi:predicted ATPase/class 3 adenylate cyclase
MIGGWYPRSFLLTDIVGSVSLWELDAELMSQAVARHDAIVGREISAAGGTLVRSKGEGDSTFSVFRHPVEAVAAAIAIQQALATEAWPVAMPLRVRAGVHTGDAEPRDGDWYGPAVNRAARLRALAEGGQTLVSGVTAGLVADQLPRAVRLLYRGRRALRGIERPEEVWELVVADDPRLTVAESLVTTGLPATLTRFVGRTADVRQLVELVEEHRLVTLTGPGGSGKTRLALEVAGCATRRGEVVWPTELAPLREEQAVALAVAVAVGIEPGGRDPLDELMERPELLAGLLVLDNCEHLVDACATVTSGLLGAAPDLRVLATSREPLGVPGEREWPVRPLDLPDESLRDRKHLVQVESAELLLDRARAVRPNLEVGDDDVASVVQICRVLDGMPLAIELAAGRLRSLGFADLAGRLSNQLAVLVRHRSAGRDEARHRTLRTTLDWSYDLLSEDQQMLARRLSVFAGGFRLDGVEAVCGDDLDVLDGIDELVAKSLVTFDAVTARYRLLEPIRQYLAGRLEDAGEGELCRRLQAEWVAGLCERLGTRLLDDQRARSARLREESANIDVALGWALDHGHHETALRIVGSLGQYWCFNDHAGGRRWCEQVLDAGADAFPRRRAKALLSAGMVAQQDQAWERSIGWLRDALAIYQAVEATAGQAASLLWLGRALRLRREPVDGDDDIFEADACVEESLKLSIQLGDRVTAGWCRISLSQQAIENQDLDRAEQLSHQVIEECDAAGARHPVGQALCNLAYIAIRRGELDDALALVHDAIALYRDLDDPWQTAGALQDLAALASIAGRGAEALQALAEAVQLGEQVGRLARQPNVLATAAVVHLARGERALAISALGAYDAHRPPGPRGGYLVLGPLAGAVDTARAQLDPAAVATATARAHTRQIGELTDELIIQPSKSTL